MCLIFKLQRCNPLEENCKIRFQGYISEQMFTVSWWYWLTGTLLTFNKPISEPLAEMSTLLGISANVSRLCIYVVQFSCSLGNFEVSLRLYCIFPVSS